MGRSQQFAATFAVACSLNIECQHSDIDFRLKTKYVDKQAATVQEALDMIAYHTTRKEAVSIALCGNAAELLPQLVEIAKQGGMRPDIVTDQTSAHDIINGYLPIGWTLEDWRAAQKDPSRHAAPTQAAGDSCSTPVKAFLAFLARGIPTFAICNNPKQVSQNYGHEKAM